MAKHDIDDDPAFALNAEAKALARQRQLDTVIDQILKAETIRNQASEVIQMLWAKVEKEGFDLRDSRRQFLRRSLAKRHNP